MRGLTGPELDKALRDRIGSGTARIEKTVIDGEVFWIKRPEHLSLRMRLQKGNALEAFEKEIAAHQEYAARGLPVAPVVWADSTALVTRDCGPNLMRILRTEPDAVFQKALGTAARALATLHGAGVSHGRPSLKDICWKDDGIAFLDLERADASRNTVKGRAMDVLILLFSTAVETGGRKDAMQIVRDAYVETAPPEVWPAAVRRLRRLAFLRYLAAPVARLLRGKKEFDAVAPFFDFVNQDMATARNADYP